MNDFIIGFLTGGALFFIIGAYMGHRETKKKVSEEIKDILNEFEEGTESLPAFLRKQAD